MVAAIDPVIGSVAVALIGGAVTIITYALAREAKRSSDDAADAAQQARADRDACRDELAWAREHITLLARKNGVEVSPYPEGDDEERGRDDGPRRSRRRRP